MHGVVVSFELTTDIWGSPDIKGRRCTNFGRNRVAVLTFLGNKLSTRYSLSGGGAMLDNNIDVACSMNGAFGIQARGMDAGGA